MNAMNRVVIVVLLVIAILLCSTVLVVPTMIGAITQQMVALTDLLNNLRPWARVGLGILFALTLDIILGLLIIVEVRRPAPKFVRVEKATGGDVLVSVTSIADRLRYEIDALANVLRVKTRVSVKRKGVVVTLDVETVAGLDVPTKAEQIVETARQVVEESMGLKLTQPPKVNLHAVPFPTTAKARVPTRLPSVAIEPEEPSFVRPEEQPPVEPDSEETLTPTEAEESPPLLGED